MIGKRRKDTRLNRKEPSRASEHARHAGRRDVAIYRRATAKSNHIARHEEANWDPQLMSENRPGLPSKDRSGCARSDRERLSRRFLIILMIKTI
jgi:hypothetical protein